MLLQQSIVADETPNAPSLPQVGVKDARRSEKIVIATTARSRSRILFITEDPEVAVDGSDAQLHFLQFAELFDEVHVMLIKEGKRQQQVERTAANVFFYQVAAPYWWLRRREVVNLVEQHLVFNKIPRPDIVVAMSPGEAGESARLCGRLLKRPWQVQVLYNPYDLVYLNKDTNNKKKTARATRLLKKAVSIRTASETIKQEIAVRAPHVEDITVLPQYYNLAAYKNGVATFDVHERYPQYIFTMIAEGVLTADSALHDVFAAAQSILRNPRVGLIVLGDGPARALFKEKVVLLGIEKNVVFIHNVEDIVSYYKTADLLIETSHDKESEERVLRAISSELPIAAYHNPFRDDLLVDGESAILVDDKDSYALTQKISKFLNSGNIRTRFAEAERAIATARLEENKEVYLLNLRDSIESTLLEE